MLLVLGERFHADNILNVFYSASYREQSCRGPLKKPSERKSLVYKPDVPGQELPGLLPSAWLPRHRWIPHRARLLVFCLKISIVIVIPEIKGKCHSIKATVEFSHNLRLNRNMSSFMALRNFQIF